MFPYLEMLKAIRDDHDKDAIDAATLELVLVSQDSPVQVEFVLRLAERLSIDDTQELVAELALQWRNKRDLQERAKTIVTKMATAPPRLNQQEMFEASFKRPKNFFALTSQEQWDIDRELGILDMIEISLNCNQKERFNDHYDPKP